HRPSIALELAVEALRENPHDAQARRALGYVEDRGVWRTPFEVKQLRTGKVWHDKFGWLPAAHVARYEKGERFCLGRWMPAEKEAEVRQDIARGWRIESEHYVVTTNHSLEEGVALSKKLETLYGLWRQVFASYLASETELARQLEGNPLRRDQRQH